MYISPLLLLTPEFAADYVEENDQLFDVICLRKYEKLDDIVDTIIGCNGEIDTPCDGLSDGVGDGYENGLGSSVFSGGGSFVRGIFCDYSDGFGAGSSNIFDLSSDGVGIGENCNHN